jgi:hypothetical protein
MEIKFREVKSQCLKIVKKYREARKDDREFPEFLVQCLASDGSRGSVRLYRKKYRKEPYLSKGIIHFESIAELALIMESLGRAWASGQ